MATGPGPEPEGYGSTNIIGIIVRAMILFWGASVVLDILEMLLG